ncbi:MAG: hypothetical protein MJZ11_06960 [Lachnospiraceae bacterium]|nr:hypothetical protein [Lachnospiraceae bacterium]
MLFLEKNKILNSTSVLLLSFVLFGILGPLETYAASPADFNFSFWTVLTIEGIVSTVFLIVGFILLVAIPTKLSNIVTRIIFTVAVSSYIQYMFFNRELSRKDGRPMDWNSMHSTMIINFVEWLVVVAIISILLFIFRSKWNKTCQMTCLILILIQLVAIASMVITVPKGSNDAYQLSAENQYTLAKDENIIVLILDSYGNRMFEQAINDDESILCNLKDFTYYNNCDSQYDRTYPTVTAMITGFPFDFDSDNPENYTTQAWTSDKSTLFFDQMHKKGWKFNVYASNAGLNYGNLVCNADKIDNIEYAEGQIRWKRLLVHFTKASLYKFSPYFLKPYFEQVTGDFKDINGYANSFDDHLEHLSRVLSEDGISLSKDVGKQITIFHTFGAHDAKNVDDLKQCHDFIDLYLEKIKAAGIYDDSTIIITADHGMMWSFAGKDPQPIFLIKLPNESNTKIEILNSPISEADFQATIMKLIEVDTSAFGKSIFEWNEGDKRERTIYFNESPDKYVGYTYFTNRDELLIKLDEKPDVYGEKMDE